MSKTLKETKQVLVAGLGFCFTQLDKFMKDLNQNFQVATYPEIRYANFKGAL